MTFSRFPKTISISLGQSEMPGPSKPICHLETRAFTQKAEPWKLAEPTLPGGLQGLAAGEWELGRQGKMVVGKCVNKCEQPESTVLIKHTRVTKRNRTQLWN